jgi:hypothetical protein
MQYPPYFASAGVSAGPSESLVVLLDEQVNRKGGPESIRYVFGGMGMEQFLTIT